MYLEGPKIHPPKKLALFHKKKLNNERSILQHNFCFDVEKEVENETQV